MSDDANPEPHYLLEGRWIDAIGFRLLPKSHNFAFSSARVAELEKAVRELWPHFDAGIGIRSALPERLQEVYDALHSTAESYNAQPVWHLAGLEISPKHVKEALSELARATEFTAHRYDWFFRTPGTERLWRVHAWKHIYFGYIQSYWQGHLKGETGVFSIVQEIGSRSEVRNLFRAAENRDPEAVGRVWALFPQKESHQEIFRIYFLQKDRPKELPDPPSIAAELVEIIFKSPEAERATRARADLLKLISPSVSSGSKLQKGRQKALIPTNIVCLIWQMSYAMAVQVREVHALLDKRVPRATQRNSLLLDLYPWLGSLQTRDPTWNALSFVESEPGLAAFVIVEHITGFSQRSLERLSFRTSV